MNFNFSQPVENSGNGDTEYFPKNSVSDLNRLSIQR